MEECEASADVLLSDTMDQYRTFQMCERLLYSPAKLGNQLLFQIPPHLQAILIERCSIYADIFRCISVDSFKGSSHVKHIQHSCGGVFFYLEDTMLLMMHLYVRFWEKSSQKEPRKTLMISVRRQM